MPPRFGTPEDPERVASIDTTKRYDVYVMEYGQRLAVLRNVLFKGFRTLFDANDRLNVMSAFIELEQANGQAVFVSRHSLVRFCEHGTKFDVDAASPA